jgi:transforming growth factor-beta-induced protein
LVEALKGKGPLTVFAPTDEAFAKLPPGTVENLLKPENKDKLKAVRTYHVVLGRVTAGEVVNLSSAPTLNGRSVHISAQDGKVTVDNARVVQTDIMATKWSQSRDRFGYFASMIQTKLSSAAGY